MIFKGLPGSGKSTEAAALVKKEAGRWVRVNRDDLRGMICGPGNNPFQSGNRNEREETVRVFRDELIRQAFRKGCDVICDDTNLVPATVKKLHALAMAVGDVKVIEKGINVSVEECLRRDKLRTGFAQVGEKVIKDMARGSGIDKGRKLSDKEAYYAPRWTPGGSGADPSVGEQDEALPLAVIVDLDGTLCLMNGRSPFDYAACVNDLPNKPVIELVKAFHGRGVHIIFMSGRDDKYRVQTEQWIKQWVTVPNNTTFFTNGRPTTVWEPISYDLHMRPAGDMRKDTIVKPELFDKHVRGKYFVLFCVDDRSTVVDKWREMGLTCMQVAPGNF
jgi:predicted kinase